MTKEINHIRIIVYVHCFCSFADSLPRVVDKNAACITTCFPRKECIEGGRESLEFSLLSLYLVATLYSIMSVRLNGSRDVLCATRCNSD